MMRPPQPERLRPSALRPGDTVGIVAPASGFRRDDFEAGCETLRRLGYKLFYLPSIFERDSYFAGPIERRVAELHEMFARKEVRAILCARGGYGSNYLLPHLDLKLIRDNPKILAGCSDVTTLLTHICDTTGLAVLHAPMVAGDFSRPNGIDRESWLAAVSGENGSQRAFPADEVYPLSLGRAQGMLYGGCLSLICASLGTPYEIHTEGTVLFLEDRAEKPYRIDRMLMQLKLAGRFAGVRGVIFGEMLDCTEPGSNADALHQVIERVLGDLKIPMAIGLRSGHVSRNAITLPFGVNATLNVAGDVTLAVEAAVQSSHPAVPVSR
jgi:muramoyltetrapeptide carboxypeptidase